MSKTPKNIKKYVETAFNYFQRGFNPTAPFTGKYTKHEDI